MKITKLIKNPLHIFLVLGVRGFFNWMSDILYLKIIFRAEVGYSLDLENPKTFNEKLQWLKLYDRNPLYTQLVDKYEVRKFISEKIGEEYLIPLLGVWNRAEEVDFDKLPEQFVLKCTHDGGGNSVIICKDKNNFDFKKAKKKLGKCLKRNIYWFGREWPYKNVKPRIIAEKYMVDESGEDLKDYKLFAFNGETKAIQVDFDRFVNHRRNIYTINWEYIPLSILYPTDPNYTVIKPSRLDKMIDIANKLSKDFPHLRVDLYYVNDNIYFGELTFYHGSGYEKFVPEKYGDIFGSWITLPEKLND